MLINCANCNRKQEDAGIKQTCSYCGCSPLPSYSYPPYHAFYPAQPENEQSRIERLVAQRRAERAAGG